MMEETTAGDNSAVVDNKIEDVSAELASGGDAEPPVSDGGTQVKLGAEAASTSEPVENGESEPAVDAEEAHKEHEASVVLGVDSSCEGEPSKVDRDREEEVEEEEVQEEEEDRRAAPEDNGYGGDLRLLRELQEERDEASRHGARLQAKLAEYLRRKAGEAGGRPEGEGEGEVEGERSEAVLRQEYGRCMEALAELKRRLAREAEAARARAEELRLQTREKRREVDAEWRALLLLKQEVAVAALSRRLGREAARAGAAAALAAEQLRQDRLTALRLRHARLGARVRRLEAELGGEEEEEEEERGGDPLLAQFERLRWAMLERKGRAERQGEEGAKLREKISGCSERLAEIKEKLRGRRADARAARARLAAAEAALAAERDVLTGTRRARGGLQRDNLRLKERRGLLGNRALLRDLQDAAAASGRLEERLGELMARRAQIGRGGWRGTPGTAA